MSAITPSSRVASASSRSSAVASAMEAARSSTIFTLISSKLSVASPRGGRISWMQALDTLHAVSRRTRQQVRPKSAEQIALVEAMPTDFARSVLVHQCLKTSFGVRRLSQDVVSLMLVSFRHRRHIRGAYAFLETERILERDSVTHKVRVDGGLNRRVVQQLLMIIAASALFVPHAWEDALAVLSQYPTVVSTSSPATRSIVNAVGTGHSLQKAMDVAAFLRRLQLDEVRRASRLITMGFDHGTAEKRPRDRNKQDNRHVESEPFLDTFHSWGAGSAKIRNAALETLLLLLRTANGPKHMQHAFEIAADFLASGEPLTLTTFFPIAMMLNRRAQWEMVLDVYANQLDVFRSSESHAQLRIPHRVLTTLMNALAWVDPYHNVGWEEMAQHMKILLAPPRDSRITMTLDRRFALVFPVAVHASFSSYTIRIANALAAEMPEISFTSGPAENLMTAALARPPPLRRVLIVLDTNVLLHAAAKNMALESFLPHLKAALPHVRDVDDSRFEFVVPSTVVTELRRKVSAVHSRRSRHIVRTLVWKRIIRLLQGPSGSPHHQAKRREEATAYDDALDTSEKAAVRRTAASDVSCSSSSLSSNEMRCPVHVLSYASDFPAVAFQLISRCVMEGSDDVWLQKQQDVVGRADEVSLVRRNPDESIANLCLWLQMTARKIEGNETVVSSSRVSRGSTTGSFLRFHFRRFFGQTMRPGCDNLVLMTFDRDLSNRADRLGVDVYPSFASSSESRRTVRSTRDQDL